MSRLLLGLLILLASVITSANTVFQIDDELSEGLTLSRQVDFLFDESLSLSLNSARASKDWQPIERDIVNFGFNSAALWLRFELQVNQTNDYILHIPYPILDYLDHYAFIDGIPLKPVHTGDARIFDSRAVDHINFVFPYSLQNDQTLKVYLRVDSQGTLDVPLRFSSKDSFLAENESEIYFRGFVMGILWLMLFYNLFIYLSIKDHVYGFYVINIFAYLVMSNAYDGGAFQLLWPNSPSLNDYIFPIFNGLSQLTSLVFMMALLQVMDSRNWYKYYFLVLIAIVCTFPVLGAVLPYSTIVPIQVVFSLLVYSSALVLGLHLSVKGNRTALYFTVAMGLFLVGIVSSNLKGLGLLPTNFFTQHAFQLGFFFDMVVLSLALAQKIDIARKERSWAQRENIKNLRRYEDLYSESLSGNFKVSLKGDLISINGAVLNIMGYATEQELLTDGASHSVNRFSVDDNATARLLFALKNLGYVVDFEQVAKRKDGKLIWVSISIRSIKNSEGITEYYEGSMLDINERKENETLREQAMIERMSTLEQLVIGISHEINTPLGTSITAISHLKQLVIDMNQSRKEAVLDDSLIDAIINQELDAIDLTSNSLARVSELIKQFKHISVNQLGYVIEDINLLAVMTSGLAKFNSALEKNNINVQVNCEESINICTYGEAINEIIEQLVSNSLDHAFQSMDDKRIEITATLNGENVEIQYKDNGSGLTEQGQSEVFNPFYTTMRGYEGKIGLGMYLTFNLLTQLLAGGVEVENPDNGVSIILTFPSKLSAS
jgi:PAS domain S-box-containing protein